MRQLRILFFGEAVTLAHVARPMSLAAGLSRLGHQCMIAADPVYERFLRDEAWEYAPIHSLPGKVFLQALAKGRPHHDYALLKSYVQEDLRVINQFKPDLVIGDFRLSLSISARLAKIPYAALVNAYWSPLAAQPLPIPVLPFTRLAPIWLAQAIMNKLGSAVVRGHCIPINRLRRENGLPDIGTNIRLAYSEADFYLYPDIEALFGMQDLPYNHAFLGPVHWEPQNAAPDWWGDLDDSTPIVYVSLGSSGRSSDLQKVLDALAPLPLQVIASSAAAACQLSVPRNARIAQYLPGAQATRKSTFVITNGGSLSVNQAVCCGVPLLAIASNMDQLLNMQPVVREGLGHMLRGDRASIRKVRATALQLQSDSRIQIASKAFARDLALAPRPDQLLHEALGRWLRN